MAKYIEVGKTYYILNGFEARAVKVLKANDVCVQIGYESTNTTTFVEYKNLHDTALEALKPYKEYLQNGIDEAANNIQQAIDMLKSNSITIESYNHEIQELDKQIERELCK